jgi:hypothetical protein
MAHKPTADEHPFLHRLGTAIFSAVGAVATAALIGLGSFLYTAADNRRKEKLEFVRGQIVDLYGPLYTLISASESVWKDLAPKYKVDFNRPLGDEEVHTWRTMLISVVEPLHDKAETTLLSSKQIILCPEVKNKLHAFVDFTESLRLTIKIWDSDTQNGNHNKEYNMPKLPYPNDLTGLLDSELSALHKREKVLDNAIRGLIDWGDVPDCALPSTSNIAQTAAKN